MEIVLKRIAKQNTYTIGRMYILKDEEVERKVNYTLNKDQKRSFCHVVDVGKLDGEHYFCDTLEPMWRNLLGITLLPPRGECASGASVGEEGAEDEGQDCHTRGHLSRAHHQVAEIQAVAAPAAGRSWL